MQSVRNDSQYGLGALGRMSIVLFGAGIMAVAALIAVWRVKQDRTVTLAAASQELATFATALGTHVEAMVGDGTGAAVAGANAMGYLEAPAGKQQMLQEMLTGGQYVRALFVIQEGQVMIANREGERYGAENLPRLSELDQAGHDIWFGVVREDRSGGMILPVARRVGTPGSRRWAGAVLRVTDLDLVYEQLKTLDTTVALVTLEGFGLIQFPLTSSSLRNIDIKPSPAFQKFLRMPEQKITLVEAPHPTTGEPRLYAAYRMQGLPAIATSGRSLDAALQGWQRRSGTLTFFLTLWLSLVLVLAIWLQVLYNRRWSQLRRLAVAQGEVAEARRAQLHARQGLTRELLVAQERERSRLASELHDGVGQNLSLLRNRVLLLKRGDLPEQAQQHAAALLDLASETIEDLRGVAHNLRPMHLEELGLTSALKALVERVELSSELRVLARVEDVDDVLQGERAVHVYRIAQEAINNVLRHAGARNLWVDVIRDISHVELRIRDDGRGMPEQAAGSRGLGLSSISERSEILGATLALRPGQPSGTCLSLRIPLQGAEDGTATAAGGSRG